MTIGTSFFLFVQRSEKTESIIVKETEYWQSSLASAAN